MQAVPASISYEDLLQLCQTLQQHNAEQQQQIASLQHQLDSLKKMIFGSRQERFIPAEGNPSQLSLAIQADTSANAQVTKSQPISYIRHSVTVQKEVSSHPGRMKLPEHLRREQIIIEPAGDISGCKKMGEEITEVLDYVPGELYVKQYRRIKYAKPENAGVLIGELPVRPVEKAMAAEGLLAQVVIDKYVDHLPLYRQMQRFERSGVKLAYSTLTDWVSSTCGLIAPLYEALKKEVLQSGYLHMDETPIKVLDREKKKKNTSGLQQDQAHRGYYWVVQNSLEKIVFFEYSPSRGRDAPMELLKNFSGYLQSDGYNVYDVFDQYKGITLLHCMAHARRMFNEAMDNDPYRAAYILEQMQQLYAIERNGKEQQLSFDEIKAERQQKAVPLLRELGGWMKEQYVQVLPKSPIGKALAYSIERWDRLSLYTSDGRLTIDNNPVENSIRPVAIGKKNYLFAGSHEAAARSGILYSLLGTCKLHGIEPYAWLKDILHRIPTHPINKIAELLPHRWTPENL